MSSLTRQAGRLGVILCMLGMVLGVAAPAHALDYYQATNGATGKCLDADYYTANTNGATVQVWDCWGGPNQQWAKQNCNWLDQCEIVNLMSGKCLDADAWHVTTNGDTVQLWDCWGGANQYWYLGFPDYSGRWQVINQASGKCLDADANNPNNGAKVQLWDCWYVGVPPALQPAPNQTWTS